MDDEYITMSTIYIAEKPTSGMIEQAEQLLRNAWRTGKYIQARGQEWEVCKTGGVNGINSYRLELPRSNKRETDTYTLGEDSLSIHLYGEVYNWSIAIQEIIQGNAWIASI